MSSYETLFGFIEFCVANLCRVMKLCVTNFCQVMSYAFVLISLVSVHKMSSLDDILDFDM